MGNLQVLAGIMCRSFLGRCGLQKSGTHTTCATHMIDKFIRHSETQHTHSEFCSMECNVQARPIEIFGSVWGSCWIELDPGLPLWSTDFRIIPVLWSCCHCVLNYESEIHLWLELQKCICRPLTFMEKKFQEFVASTGLMEHLLAEILKGGFQCATSLQV